MSYDLSDILISSSQPQFNEKLNNLYERQLKASLFDIESGEWGKILEILRDVAKNGYEAVRRYTNEFDNVDLSREQFQVSKKDFQKAHKETPKDLLKSIRQTIKNVRQYQSKIFVGINKSFKTTGIKYTPIQRIGICVPGASAPLPSTVIMCAVPAQVAGVKEIVVVSPPRPKYKNSIHSVTLAVCYELGISEVYKVGGAQAVAALASKDPIPKVDKIVGPGNKWVTTAKKMVANRYVSIDSVAGPSEVLIIANEKANPAWVAADMLSQAEHGTDSTAIAVTWSGKMGEKILSELEKQLEELPKAEQAEKSLRECGAIVIARNNVEAIKIANELAIEHLQIQCGDKSGEIAKKIENAGAIFIGDYSPVAVGDYWAGPSHTLPTSRSARFSSALTSNDFIKSTSIIEYDKRKLAESAEDIIRLAEAEGLDAHARSVRIRQGE
ncbi:MAG: histidinol dehydrogenase [Sedimentisphaerales bacterium]|nr:histidinol dehydrogenase [Sedimentisphaerales bacterium]